MDVGDVLFGLSVSVVGLGVPLSWMIGSWRSKRLASTRKRLELDSDPYRTRAEIAESGLANKPVVFCKDCKHYEHLPKGKLFDHGCRSGPLYMHPVFGTSRKVVNARRKNAELDCSEFSPRTEALRDAYGLSEADK